jgi:hypothetical protein
LTKTDGLNWAKVDFSSIDDARCSLTINSEGKVLTYTVEVYIAGDTTAPRVIGFVVLAILIVLWIVGEVLLKKFEAKYGGGAEGQEYQSKRKTRFF